jgi:cobalt-zinc-cadmium efflux system membrane fusion protein
MNARQSLTVMLILFALLAGCGGPKVEHRDEHAEHAGEEHEERGPHGGRVFHAEGYDLELLISDDEEPPAMLAYLHDAGGKGLRPSGERLRVLLTRFGGRRDTIDFRVDGDHFHGVNGVAEPHSFDAVVRLVRGGKPREWTYSQVESRVELAAEAVRQAGIETDRAGPSLIDVTIESPGEIRLDAERTVQVRPRFPGAVRALDKRLGDRVARGERLASVHSNESLAEYAITAPMSGTIVAQEAAVGQTVDHESVLYTVADLARVWVDFPIYPQSAGRIRPGQAVRVRTDSGPPLAGSSEVRYVGPLLEQDTRVSYGRAILDNRDRRWQPGAYVAVAVTVERVEVPVAVPDAAIVRMTNGPAVFRSEGGRFEMQPVVVGRTDGLMTEIVSGLEPGALIAVRNTFLLKAELGKSEAVHEH